MSVNVGRIIEMAPKPIGRMFGMTVLFFLAFGMAHSGEYAASCTCVGCALIFDAIKTK